MVGLWVVQWVVALVALKAAKTVDYLANLRVVEKVWKSDDLLAENLVSPMVENLVGD